jgi:hypothetical protein
MLVPAHGVLSGQVSLKVFENPFSTTAPNGGFASTTSIVGGTTRCRAFTCVASNP